MEYLNEPRVMLMKEKLKETQNEAERLQIIQKLFKEMRKNSDSIINKMDEGVMIDNFDEVRAEMANQFNKSTKKLMGALNDLKISNDEWMRIISALKREESKAVDSDVQTVYVKKHKNKVEVTNFDDFPIFTGMKVSNLKDLKEYFDKLGGVIKDTFNVEIVPPVVNVEAPRIDVPAPIVNNEFDLSDLKDYLKKVNQSLKNIKNNRVTNPLAVRLTDGEEFIDQLERIVETQRQQVASFPGKIQLHKNAEVSVKSPGSIANGSKDVTTAGTAEALASSSTPCKWVIIGAKDSNTGKVFIGGSSVSSTSGSFLYPGATEKLEISDLKDVYIDVSSDGEGVQFTYA